MLERFRTKPKKPLSVTDLVTPAWCEQQYEYNLTKHGRVLQTKAMKQGSKVHKVLEEQVHKVVPIETVSKEDRFGLRVWNTIEGLRALREEGLTRELEVWGVVDGEMVIGIIDEISTVCPDEQMEASLLEDIRSPSSKESRAKRKTEHLAPGQKTLADFLSNLQSSASPFCSSLENNSAFLGTLQPERPTYYLKDIKTRQSRSLPAAGASSRPTHMQLMLYHRLITALASNEVPADTIFDRYSLDPHRTFSDTFIAEIANLNMPDNDHEDPLSALLANNTLTSLWSLMIAEFAQTFPSLHPTSTNPSISPLLTASFRTASAKGTEPAGTVIGQRCFPFEKEVIDSYLQSEMAWWKGQRATVGVEVEEAFKCRICDFAEVCTWRKTKVEEEIKKARLRRDGVGRSAV
jgi:exonuclease V